jgi:two-component system nitrate/nitrite response regulator NarL
MPDISGLALLRRIRMANLPVRPVFLTALITPQQLSEAIENGIWGVVLKEAAPNTLIDCLRSVARGCQWLPQEMARQANRVWRDDGPSLGLAALTPREMEIAAQACRGLSNRDIARQLGAGEGTVKIHLHNIFQKLRITNRTALAAIYFEGVTVANGEPPKG